MKAITTKTLIIICAIVLIASVGLAAAYSQIWSPKSAGLTPTHAPTVPTALSAPTWTGTTNVGDTITLSSTFDRTPTNAQTVQFYYTYLVATTSSTTIGSDPTSQWVAVGSPVLSSGNTVTTTFVVPDTISTIYFIAVDASPV